jgi:hypothetical protein
MPTWTLPIDWTYALWTVATFVGSFVPHSFMEWVSHRFVLHSKAIVKFAYEEHDQAHHKEYGPDETFCVPGKDYGVDFHVRDWLIFLVIVMPMWAGVEVLTGKPLMLGALCSALLWLQTFNVIHRHFHAPDGSWFERTWYFKYLREHHRKHHADTKVNLNVAFPPLTDFILRTLKR